MLFKLGFNDQRAGKQLDDCPYLLGSQAYIDYKNGWQLAKNFPSKSLGDLILEGPSLNEHELGLVAQIFESITERSGGNKEMENLLRYTLQDLVDNCKEQV